MNYDEWKLASPPEPEVYRAEVTCEILIPTSMAPTPEAMERWLERKGMELPSVKELPNEEDDDVSIYRCSFVVTVYEFEVPWPNDVHREVEDQIGKDVDIFELETALI